MDLSAAHQELTAQYEEIQKKQLDLERGSEIQTVLREIADAAATASSLPVMYETVHRIVKRILPADNVYITLLDEVTGDIVRPYSEGSVDSVPRRRPAGKGWTEYVMRMGRTIHFGLAEREQLFASGELELTIQNCCEWLGSPLSDSLGNIFGVIALFSTNPTHSFAPDDSAVLSIIAAQISLAIQRKSAEIALITNESRMKRAQSMALVGNWEIELSNKLVWASDEAYRIYGLVKETEYLPLPAIQQLVCVEDRPRLDLALKLLLAGKEKYDIEFKIFRADNGLETLVHSKAEVEYGPSGNPIKVLGVIQDITARKRVEQAVAESEARYRAVMEQASEAVFICDPVSGVIMEANSRFTDRFGYDLNRDKPFSVFDLTVDGHEKIDSILAEARQNGFLPVQRRIMRHRSGIHLQVERSATLVRYRDRSLLVQTLRDVSDEVRREQEIRRDAELATRVQQALLKEADSSDYLEVTTIYEPHTYVGGDLYFMDWRYDGSLLRGFLVDAAGHGLATALHTSAMHVLLREVNELDLPLTEQMRWLNRRAGQYFDDATFAGALGFELDLQTRQLRWSCAGMPLVWRASKERQGIIMCPGMYLGICASESFELHTLPLTEGDSVCFMTDGLSEAFGRNHELQPTKYSDMVALLREIAVGEECHDDATAICIQVKALPHSSVRRDGWPRTLRFDGYGDYQRLKEEVGRILAEATGKKHSMIEVAVHEALCNAMECRDGVPRQHRARLRMNKVGNRLVVRVKTSRIGFAGNAMLRRLRVNPADMFSFGEDAGMGRGIPIMLSVADRMMYNSEGTEIMLAWKLT